MINLKLIDEETKSEIEEMLENMEWEECLYKDIKSGDILMTLSGGFVKILIPASNLNDDEREYPGYRLKKKTKTPK